MTRTAGTDASTVGGLHFQTYQKLLRQKQRIDKELDTLQTQLLRDLSKQNGQSVPFKRPVGRPRKIVQEISKLKRPVGRPRKVKKYVDRAPGNTLILIDAVCESMSPGKKMTMKQIFNAVKKKGIYKTNTSDENLYKMINNKLHAEIESGSGRIEKIENARGVFVYHDLKEVKASA